MDSSKSKLSDRNYNNLYEGNIIQEQTGHLYLGNEEITKSSKYVALIIQEEKVLKPLLSTLDIIISAIVVGPCVVGFWRAVWELLEIYKLYFPLYESLFLSLFAHVVFNIVQDSLHEIFSKKQKNRFRKVLNYVFGRFYTYVFAVSGIMGWRSLWAILENWSAVMKTDFGSIRRDGSGWFFAVCGLCFGLMVLSKSVINGLSLPFVIALDKKEETFVIPTRFKAKMGEKTSLYILDCLFSVLVIGTLVVFVWRGAWALLDIFLFPDNIIWSSWSSLILGYSAVLLAFVIQPFMRWLCDRLTGAPRLLIADLFLIFSLIGTVNVWRGIWNLLNLYFIPDDLELSCWITHWVCLILLILLGCSNSLLVRGVYIDAEEPAGKCVVFPCYYLRVIFQEQKLKKMKSQEGKERSDKTEMDNVKSVENNHIVNLQNNEQHPAQTLEINHKEGDV